jgi:hypothetical protein
MANFFCHCIVWKNLQENAVHVSFQITEVKSLIVFWSGKVIAPKRCSRNSRRLLRWLGSLKLNQGFESRWENGKKMFTRWQTNFPFSDVSSDPSHQFSRPYSGKKWPHNDELGTISPIKTKNCWWWMKPRFSESGFKNQLLFSYIDVLNWIGVWFTWMISLCKIHQSFEWVRKFHVIFAWQEDSPPISVFD